MNAMLPATLSLIVLNIMLFYYLVLSPDTFHLTQSLDVALFGPEYWDLELLEMEGRGNMDHFDPT
jgi:hypothetical protein